MEKRKEKGRARRMEKSRRNGELGDGGEEGEGEPSHARTTDEEARDNTKIKPFVCIDLEQQFNFLIL